MHAFRTYILPKFKQAAVRSLCDSWASCLDLGIGLASIFVARVKWF